MKEYHIQPRIRATKNILVLLFSFFYHKPLVLQIFCFGPKFFFSVTSLKHKRENHWKKQRKKKYIDLPHSNLEKKYFLVLTRFIQWKKSHLSVFEYLFCLKQIDLLREKLFIIWFCIFRFFNVFGLINCFFVFNILRVIIKFLYENDMLSTFYL